MKNYLTSAIRQKIQSLISLFRGLCIHGITQSHSLPAFPSIEWELGTNTDYRQRVRLLARFFFLLGCITLGTAIGVYLWQSSGTL